MQTLIVPAIITNTQDELDAMLEKVRGRAKRVQLDVMDGKFVSNTSLSFDFKLSDGFEYEAHLMVEKPLEWVEKNAGKVDIVTIHVETLQNLEDAIESVKKKGVKLTLAVNPETQLTFLHLLHKIDGILIMTVNPGDYCVKKEFLPEPLEKVRKLRDTYREFPIEVDGCMDPEHARMAKNSGANIFASGSYIFKNNDIGKAIKELEEAVST